MVKMLVVIMLCYVSEGVEHVGSLFIFKAKNVGSYYVMLVRELNQ